MKEDRKKVWIDGVQTRLFLRIGAYWLIYQVAVWNFLFAWRLLQEGPGDLVHQYGQFFADFYPTLICFAVAVPILCWDAVKFSHRLMGPIFRLRRSMQSVTAGEAVRPVKLREGDFLGEVKDDFNTMLEALQRQGLAVLKPADLSDSTQQQSA
jgi:methyl-accepting chemotaxis protein